MGGLERDGQKSKYALFEIIITKGSDHIFFQKCDPHPGREFTSFGWTPTTNGRFEIACYLLDASGNVTNTRHCCVLDVG